MSGVPPFGKARAALDELGGDVERGGNAVLDQHRQREVGEVGGAVVEGDRDRGLARGGRVSEAREPVGQRHDTAGGAELGDLVGEQFQRQVDVDRRCAVRRGGR